jgi:nitrogen-specific signal transduction histidine kinase
MLHGEIKVESRPGETTFTVSIPVDPEASHG